ncbi:MAG TPA: hypothetical protein VK645_15885 [Chitinophagaceae bacterium]|nr:hypothetical protein [Chitinophagaceae bacterium]
MKFRRFFCAVMILFSCCLRAQKQGIVKVHVYVFGPDGPGTTLPFDISYRIWYKNSRSIQEVPLLVFKDDSSGKSTSVKIKHFSYLDPDRNVCINYASFSGISKILKHYSNVDSVSKNGGWNFYSDAKLTYDSLKNLSDTVINNIAYGRIRMDRTINDDRIYLILYFRCDKKGTWITAFKTLSDSIGCPIVWDDSFIKNRLFMTRELEFVSDKLSQKELTVFDAWEKNAGGKTL